jgi:predicted XRE-type DNA-binding protein
MIMAVARSWKDVRADVARRGLIDEKRVSRHRQRLDAEVRAYRLRQIREAQHVNQSDVAETMHVSQSRVSRIERGEIAHAEVGTLQSYIEALGGRLRMIADFGDEQLVIGP